MNDLDIGKIKAAAQAVINAATVSDGFNSVAEYMEAVSSVETLALIERLEKVTAEHSRAVKTLQKAGDTARQQAAMLRAALVGVVGVDGLLNLKAVKNISMDTSATWSGNLSGSKLTTAIDALIATHKSNNKAAIHDAEEAIPYECLDGRLCLLVCTGGEFPTDETDQWFSLGFKNGQNTEGGDWHLVGWLWEHDEFKNLSHSKNHGIVVNRAIDLKKFLL